MAPGWNAGQALPLPTLLEPAPLFERLVLLVHVMLQASIQT